MKIKDVVGFNKKRLDFVVGSHDMAGNEVKGSAYNQADIKRFLAGLSSNGDVKAAHEALAQNIVEPIEKVVPYIEIYAPIFFQDQQLGYTDDNAIPVEDTVAMAWETHADSAVMFTASGFYWTRPSFTTWDTGIEVRWEMLRKAGWNFLARQMRRASEALARKRDQLAKNVLDAAILSTHTYSVAGGKITRPSVDTVLRNQADIGYPVQRILCNPGTLMDMSDFTWNTGMFVPAEEMRQVLTNLYITNYGGAEWYVDPFVPTDTVYFGGMPNQIGWHQVRGGITAASDVDIINKRDLHILLDAEHAFYVGNDGTLAKLTITT